jgi:hypothetical protein
MRAAPSSLNLRTTRRHGPHPSLVLQGTTQDLVSALLAIVGGVNHGKDLAI